MSEPVTPEPADDRVLVLEVRAHASGYVTTADGEHISGERPQDLEDQETQK